MTRKSLQMRVPTSKFKIEVSLGRSATLVGFRRLHVDEGVEASIKQ